MAENKTKPTQVSVKAFIDAVSHDTRRADARVLVTLLKKITGKKPVMWGPSIIGFDQCHYTTEGGRKGDICMIAFSPRASSQSLYMSSGFPRYAELMAKLGKYKKGKGCHYINKLADVDMGVLEELLTEAYSYSRQKQKQNQTPC